MTFHRKTLKILFLALAVGLIGTGCTTKETVVVEEGGPTVSFDESLDFISYEKRAGLDLPEGVEVSSVRRIDHERGFAIVVDLSSETYVGSLFLDAPDDVITFQVGYVLQEVGDGLKIGDHISDDPEAFPGTSGALLPSKNGLTSGFVVQSFEDDVETRKNALVGLIASFRRL